MRRTLLALAALATAAPLAAAKAPVELAPSSQWNVDFARDKCQLIRTFGEGENKHFLRFQQYAPGDAAGLTVAGPAFKPFRSRALTDLRFFEGQTPHRTRPFTGTVEGFGDGVIFSGVTINEGMPEEQETPPATSVTLLDTALGKQVQFVELRQGGRTVRLKTGPLNAAFDVLNQCALDLLRDWGLDPEKHLTAISAPRWTNPDAIVRRIQSDYPSEAARRGEQAILRMRVIVSEQGKVESCTLIEATETKDIESPACRLMGSATFEPARDAAGMPFKSYFATSLTYRLG
ncbi:MAG: energy transducer TonB [Erythrobacter sp.]|jgi:TonB family protein